MIIVWNNDSFEAQEAVTVGPFIVHRHPRCADDGSLEADPAGHWIATHAPTWLGVYKAMPASAQRNRTAATKWAKAFLARFPEFATMTAPPVMPDAERYVRAGLGL